MEVSWVLSLVCRICKKTDHFPEILFLLLVGVIIPYPLRGQLLIHKFERDAVKAHCDVTATLSMVAYFY